MEDRVKKLYEKLPYPHFVPHMEGLHTSGSSIPFINSYFYGGKLNFTNPFRVLIAGIIHNPDMVV